MYYLGLLLYSDGDDDDDDHDDAEDAQEMHQTPEGVYKKDS